MGLLMHTVAHAAFRKQGYKQLLSYHCYVSLELSYTLKIKWFGILTSADVIEFIDFFPNSEEEEILQDFLLLLLSLHPEKLQVMIL